MLHLQHPSIKVLTKELRETYMHLSLIAVWVHNQTVIPLILYD